MPKDITKGVSRLSIHPGDVHDSAEKQHTKPKGWYRREKWIYGFHLKNKYFRRISQKYGLPWKKQPLLTMERVVNHIRFLSRSRFRLRSVGHGNGTALIMFFVESDGRKRMKDAIASPEDMDRVRKALGLPKGTKPKWYNCYGCDEYDNAAGSSDDEAQPVSRARVPRPNPLLIVPETTGGSAQDDDAPMACNSDDEVDGGETSDESSSDDDSEDGIDLE